MSTVVARRVFFSIEFAGLMQKSSPERAAPIVGVRGLGIGVDKDEFAHWQTMGRHVGRFLFSDSFNLGPKGAVCLSNRPF